jgi:hypothetical protein
MILNVIQVKAQRWLEPQELMLKSERSQPHNVLSAGIGLDSFTRHERKVVVVRVGSSTPKKSG